MPAGVRMTFGKDISNAVKQLDDLDKAIEKSLPRAAKAGAGVLEAEAVRRAPVRSGNLKRKFKNRAATASEKTARNSAAHLVFNEAFYANAVEYSRRNGHPFYRFAAKVAEPDIARAMETAVKREASRAL